MLFVCVLFVVVCGCMLLLMVVRCRLLLFVGSCLWFGARSLYSLLFGVHCCIWMCFLLLVVFVCVACCLLNVDWCSLFVARC